MLPDSKNGTYEKSKGGTETMFRRLQAWVLDKREDKDQIQVICSRIRDLEDGKKHILWLHDMVDDPENAVLDKDDVLDKIDLFVFVSITQMKDYQTHFPKIPQERCAVIYNCFEDFFTPNAIESAIDQKWWSGYDGKIKFVYHTTPHRGLNVACAAMAELDKQYPGEDSIRRVFVVQGLRMAGTG
jgi:UDP-glucose:(glucosyl)LPS alpha-1,2-glucosyltransferase